jgi:8-oxo-dGTP pyrophosphatase MutT (NUDIX family)
MRAREFTEPQAAGCVLRAADTGRWCLQQRSDSVSDPGIWSTWGGGRESGESLEQCVRRELAEEGGYTGPLQLEPLMMNQRYATYIGHVPHEFEPDINNEVKDWCWVEPIDLPSPLHPGVAAALENVYIKENINSNKINFEIQKGKNKFATTMTVNNKPVGVYQYDANTGHSIAEIYPEYKGQGLGKLLVLHAIYTAAKLGLDFVEDESRTAEYDNVLDSLSSNGYIVSDDGYLYVTSQGEQYLKQSLKQGVAENFADGKNPGRKGLSRRVGIPKKASLTQLQKIASSSTGERRRMAQWQLNMRRGKARKNK